MAGFWCEMDTMQIQMNQNVYDCLICDHQFTSPVQLTVHYIVLHGALPCEKCLKLFNNELSLNEHIRSNHRDIKHICADCAEEFTKERDLYFHLIRVHYKKNCQLCDILVSFDECKIHLANSHKVTNLSTIIRLNIVPDHQHRFHCSLCEHEKSFDRLEKLISHFLYFHKCSLQSLIQCILNDNEIDSLRSSENCDHANLKCSICDEFYVWSTPTIFHKIYCHAFIYCIKCDESFEHQTKFIAHAKKCENGVSDIDFCDNCNNKSGDELTSHLRTVHNFSTVMIDSKVSQLMNSQNGCQFCGRNLSNETNNLNKLIEHFRILHKFSAKAILRRLNKRQDEIEVKPPKRPAEAQEILTIIKHDEHTNGKYVTDFDAKIVKYVYSSASDYDSSDADSDERLPPPKSFQCDFCKIRSKSKFIHAMHLHKKHGFELKTPEFRCNICQKNFKSNRSLKKHNQNGHHKRRENGKRFSCQFCEFCCNGKLKMRQHINEHVEISYHPCTSKAIGYNCRYCHFVFWTKEKLSEHQLCRHSNCINETYLLCSVCYTAFNNLATLRSHHATRHFNQRHEDKNAFQCKICRIVLFSMDTIRLHMQELHPEYQSIYCAKVNCMQMANTVSELNEHWTNAHANSVFQCLECFKMFERKDFVEKHMANSHAKLRKI